MTDRYIAQLEEELDRLREALRRIADDPRVKSHPDSVRVAREALGLMGEQPPACSTCGRPLTPDHTCVGISPAGGSELVG